MAKLTYGERKSMSPSMFVFPKTRSFPIPDESHGRNALARAGAKGGEVEEKVKEAVHAKFPDIGEAKSESPMSPKPMGMMRHGMMFHRHG